MAFLPTYLIFYPIFVHGSQTLTEKSSVLLSFSSDGVDINLAIRLSIFKRRSFDSSMKEQTSSDRLRFPVPFGVDASDNGEAVSLFETLSLKNKRFS